ncbi:hypothetical protein [Tenacibaculum sp.]|uniref:hypothetical protein n=1 Tax=Tenacibaculum sp. TaxID=1906242 RepID=UPI003AA92EEB
MDYINIIEDKDKGYSLFIGKDGWLIIDEGVKILVGFKESDKTIAFLRLLEIDPQTLFSSLQMYFKENKIIDIFPFKELLGLIFKMESNYWLFLYLNFLHKNKMKIDWLSEEVLSFNWVDKANLRSYNKAIIPPHLDI